jgi:hypothetical protein
VYYRCESRSHCADDHLSTSSVERKVLLVFTDGADHYSAHRFEEVRAVATLQGIPIYILGYVGDDSRTWSENGRSQIRDRFEQLARMTGGRAFFSEPDADCSEVVYRYCNDGGTSIGLSSTVQARLRNRQMRK